MRFARRFVLCVLASCALGVALAERAAGATNLLADIDAAFEVAGDGWYASGGTAAVSGAAPVHGGTGAARFTATGAGAVSFRTQDWRVSTASGAAHTLGVWVYDNDSRVSLTVELAFVDGSGGVVGIPLTTSVGADAASWRFFTLGPTTSPASATSARITIRGTATAAGATFSVDDVTLVRDDPPPTSTPTPSPTPGATTVPTSTATLTPSVTATPQPTPTLTAAAPRVYEALVNGGFDTAVPLDVWQHVGCVASPFSPGLDGAGRAALLVSTSDSTKWLTQTVTVEPGAWYSGRALLKLMGEAGAGWMRIAWYASTDGEGTQLAVADSNLATAPGVVVGVQIAAVQALAAARTARVRLMLRPAGAEFAALLTDNVQFDRTAAPAPTPVATPRVLPTPSTAPRASDPGLAVGAPPLAPAASGPSTDASSSAAAPARGGEQPAPRVAGVPTQPTQRAGVTRATSGALPLLRITEVLSDPPEAGNDADFEWIEIANLGRESASLGGLLLADNQGTIELPSLMLAPGGVIVVAGAQAKVPEGVAWWPPGGFSNGLGNAGDRIALFMADGQVIDALSYGSDSTYDRPALPAPGAGRSLVRRFADDGSFQRAEVVTNPAPGTVGGVEPRDDRASTAVEAATARPFDVAGWGALAAIGVGAVGAAAVQRYRVVRARESEPGAR